MANPLFMRFINKELDQEEIALAFVREGNLRKDAYTVNAASAGIGRSLSDFQKEMISMATVVAEDGCLNTAIVEYLNSYMSPSIIEYGVNSGARNSEWWIGIKDANSTWPEGLVCYNFSCYAKVASAKGGLASFKKCKSCGRFFDHKGPYAVYCSEMCKNSGKEKRDQY